jgi:ribosome biogenesis GTPase
VQSRFQCGSVGAVRCHGLEANVSPVIVLTKRDIYDDGSDEATAVLDSDPDDAQEIAGVPVVLVDARSDEPTLKLAEWCRPGHTVAFLGSSKSGSRHSQIRSAVSV